MTKCAFWLYIKNNDLHFSLLNLRYWAMFNFSRYHQITSTSEGHSNDKRGYWTSRRTHKESLCSRIWLSVYIKISVNFVHTWSKLLMKKETFKLYELNVIHQNYNYYLMCIGVYSSHACNLKKPFISEN